MISKFIGILNKKFSYIELTLKKNNSLKIIAWVELDVSIENLLARAKVNIHTRRNELRKRLTWLTSDVQIMNTKKYDNEITGMEVYIA